MAEPIHPIQPSFATGEVAPEIYSRVDINRYKTSLRKLHNMIVHPTGGVSNRPGTRFVAAAKYDDKLSIVQEFIFSQDDKYVLEFGEEYVRFYTNGAQVVVGAGDISNYDPATAYTGFASYAKLGDYSALDFGTSKFLYVAAVHGATTTNKDISVETNTSDALSVVYTSATESIVIKLADSTASKNTAALIQTALRAADGSLAAWTVTESAEYAADRPIASTISAQGFTDCDKIYFCISNGTGKFPPIETTYWEENTILEVGTPYQEEDLRDLRFETSADVIYITHKDYRTRTLTRYGATSWLLEEYFPTDGPFLPENITTTTLALSAATGTAAITVVASQAVFDADHVDTLFEVTHYIPAHSAASAFTGTGSGSSIACFTTWRVVSHGTWKGKVQIEKSEDGGSTWTMLREFSSDEDFNINTYGTEDIETNTEPFLVRATCVARTSGTINVDLSTDPYYQKGVVKLTAINSSTNATALIMTDAGSTAATDSWSEGAWSDYRGFPAISRFFQDRLVFANTYSNPMTMWMSVTGSYNSFKRNSILLDTDGITTNLPSRQINEINGLIAFKRLVALTTASIWSIGPVSGSALTPTGFTQDVEVYNGSNGVNPVVIGTEAIYMQEHGHIVSNLGFQFSSDSFDGSNLNVLARHLFDVYEIIDMAYQRNPDSIVWMLRDDGKLIGMTYMKEQDVVAFHWHDTGQATGDTFQSLCVVPADGFDEVWFTVYRENGIYIERMSRRMDLASCGGIDEVTPENQVFMDSSVSYVQGTEMTTVSVGSGTVYTITAPDHGYSDGDTVRLKNVSGVPALSGTSWIIGSVTTDTFVLVTLVP